jgi:hypothetical protein
MIVLVNHSPVISHYTKVFTAYSDKHITLSEFNTCIDMIARHFRLKRANSKGRGKTITPATKGI